MSSELLKNISKYIKYDILKKISYIGFWPGGDRDGNPYVTNETTRKVANLLRNTIINLYIEQIKNIRKK